MVANGRFHMNPAAMVPFAAEDRHIGVGDEGIDLLVTPEKNIVFAVNYEVSMVDQFTLLHEKTRRRKSIKQDISGDDRDTNKKSRKSDIGEQVMEKVSYSGSRSSRVVVQTDENVSNSGFRMAPIADLSPHLGTGQESKRGSQSTIRKSARGRSKREVNISRSRVKYDMQLVPPVKRNRAFMAHFFDENRHVSRRRSSRLVESSVANESNFDKVDPPPPFLEGNTSVIWKPSKRVEWEDSIPEMTAVCTSAAIRRYRIDMTSEKPPKLAKPFHAPLSRDYIRDRVDIDDPLNGYQLRHREGGWLQGFVLWTNFTTWTHYFRWDSLDAESGFNGEALNADVTGELANELEALPRSGDPHGEGVVFEGIAELSLLGGLGCGELLLRMVCEEITRSGKYRYLVLQATDSSKSFYERFGFIRVGAVCRYLKELNGGQEQPIQGYRHWTHANESERSLQKHGGPSYMMCLKLDVSPSEPGSDVSLFSELMKYSVSEKPTVGSLGQTYTSAISKPNGRRSNMIESPLFTPPKKRGPGRPPKSRKKIVGGPDKPDKTVSTSISRKETAPSTRGDAPPPPKRRKLKSESNENIETSPVPQTRIEVNLRVSSRKHRAPLKEAETVEEEKPPSPPTPKRTSKTHGRRGVRHTTPLEIGEFEAQPVDKESLLKQKVKAYPRSRLHFYNRVVKSKVKPSNEDYFFVLQYDEETDLIKIVPITPKGHLSGKRQGRPRYQAEIGETDENFAVVRAADYEVVQAAMVMKTPVVASEAWDIEDE